MEKEAKLGIEKERSINLVDEWDCALFSTLYRIIISFHHHHMSSFFVLPLPAALDLCTLPFSMVVVFLFLF